jgi:hypothetical protein
MNALCSHEARQIAATASGSLRLMVVVVGLVKPSQSACWCSSGGMAVVDFGIWTLGYARINWEEKSRSKMGCGTTIFDFPTFIPSQPQIVSPTNCTIRFARSQNALLGGVLRVVAAVTRDECLDWAEIFMWCYRVCIVCCMVSSLVCCVFILEVASLLILQWFWCLQYI